MSVAGKGGHATSQMIIIPHEVHGTWRHASPTVNQAVESLNFMTTKYPIVLFTTQDYLKNP